MYVVAASTQGGKMQSHDDVGRHLLDTFERYDISPDDLLSLSGADIAFLAGQVRRLRDTATRCNILDPKAVVWLPDGEYSPRQAIFHTAAFVIDNPRTLMLFRNSGFRTIAHVLALGRSGLAEIRDIGNAHVDQVAATLRACGLLLPDASRGATARYCPPSNQDTFSVIPDYAALAFRFGHLRLYCEGYALRLDSLEGIDSFDAILNAKRSDLRRAVYSPLLSLYTSSPADNTATQGFTDALSSMACFYDAFRALK